MEGALRPWQRGPAMKVYIFHLPESKRQPARPCDHPVRLVRQVPSDQFQSVKATLPYRGLNEIQLRCSHLTKPTDGNETIFCCCASANKRLDEYSAGERSTSNPLNSIR